jgi:hypothetical protein
MLNPIIYSLWNKAVKVALSKLLDKRSFAWKGAYFISKNFIFWRFGEEIVQRQ